MGSGPCLIKKALSETAVQNVGIKSLSENLHFGKEQLSAGQVQEGEVVLGFLFAGHQEPA
jgi:hypothetical protein